MQHDLRHWWNKGGVEQKKLLTNNRQSATYAAHKLSYVFYKKAMNTTVTCHHVYDVLCLELLKKSLKICTFLKVSFKVHCEALKLTIEAQGACWRVQHFHTIFLKQMF